MNYATDRYNNGFSPDAVKQINSINEKIQKESDKDELFKLKYKRMCLGFGINAGALGRIRNGYYPY